MKKVMFLLLLSILAQMLVGGENALSFDGIDDYVSISETITAPTTNQAVTIEAWIYPTTDSDIRVIASKYYGGDGSESNFLITRNTSQKLFIAANGTNALTSNGTVPLNAWTHIAVVYYPGTDNTKIYINGALDISGTLTYNAANSSTEMQIGQFNNISSYPVYQEWMGKIDELRLWNTVRTQAEINDYMNTPLNGAETGLVAYYGFNQGIAGGTNTGLTSLTDGTGHGWNGTLNYFALTGSVSNWVSGIMFNPPQISTALEAGYISSSGFTANWSSSQGATGYKLDVAADSLFTQYVPGYNDLDVQNVLAWNVSGLTDHIKYFYRVRAYNSIGTSANSNIVSVFTQDPQMPDVPNAAAAENISTDSFRAVWSQEDRAWGYYIDVASDSLFSDYVTGFNNKNVGNVTNTTVIPLNMDTDYFYRVRAYNAGGTSESSNTIHVKTLYSTGPVSTPPSSGSGTLADPYQIATLNNLYWIAENSTRWGYNYIQTADIDASLTKYWFSGQGWAPIGNYTTKFTGTYDGQNHIIDGLYINRPSAALNGLFGHTSSSTISNLGITNCNYTGKGYNGGLIGKTLNSTVNKCFTSGYIKSTDSYWTQTGGLIGEDSSSGSSTISNCYSSCNVEGVSHMGGLLGNAYDVTIINSYSIGHVTGTSWCGGLCGYTGGTVTNSFWDKETSGWTTSRGGIGKTTAEMMTESTFTAAGWDFTNIWKTEGGYPRFKWQTYYPGPFVYTKDISNITGNSATVTSAIYSLGNYEITQHGVCWNTTGDPTTSDSKTVQGAVSATGQFSSEMTGLSVNTNYYVRAYATNSKGTFYGAQITFLSASLVSVTPAGEGTEANPYQIANLSNLYWITENSSRWGYDYIQTADIDASITSTWNNGAGWQPIGDAAIRFTGKYNGQNHYISGIYLDKDESDYWEGLGFFGYIENSEVTNLNIINVNIVNGVRYYAGGIVGIAWMSRIDNCSCSGSISKTSSGGIVGRCDNSIISNCFSECNISSGDRSGGIAGYNYGSTLINCISKSSIAGYGDLGGLIGWSDDSTIKNCYAECNLNGSASAVGGLTGTSYTSKIINSYSNCQVTGYEVVGGLVGYSSMDSINFCYSSGSISFHGFGGGLIADNNQTFVENSFWDTVTSGVSASAGGIGKTTEQLKTESTFTDSGWDFERETINGTNDIWDIDVFNNNGYPCFSWQYPALTVPEGDGSAGNPYLITSIENLYWIYQYAGRWSYNYRQTADIDLTECSGWFGGTGWAPIGNAATKFTGVYDGQGHFIDGLLIDRPTTDYTGLFGYTYGADISNLKLTGVNITARACAGCFAGYNDNTDISGCTVNGFISGTYYVGGLVGYNKNSVISRSSALATVSGSGSVGGLSGLNYSNSIISECSTSGNVNAVTYVGGISGYNNFSSIENCYSVSDITGSSYVGGLAGYNISGSSVSDCYSSGAVTGSTYTGGLIGSSTATVNDSFWDTETSGQTSSSGGTGKTTAEMKTPSIFTGAGWDFAGETANGTNDYWNMNGTDNSGYPYLSWQVFPFQAPGNVSVTQSGSDMIISWDANPQATSYTVYSSADPYAEFPAGWTVAATGITGTTWTDTALTESRKFYVVVAVSGKEAEHFIKKDDYKERAK